MEYLNDRLVLVSQVAHTRGLIERAAPDSTLRASLVSLLDQQEAALHECDEQGKVEENHDGTC